MVTHNNTHRKAIAHDLTPSLPDYTGGSIVNLMASLGQRFGSTIDENTYSECDKLNYDTLGDAKRVALVVIDGLGDELLNHLGTGRPLKEAQIATLSSVYPPTTASAITTFMSGLAPQQHGLTGWFMHFRQLGAVTAVLPFMPRYARQALVESGVKLERVIDSASFSERLKLPSLMLQPAMLVDSAFSRALGRGADREAYRSLEEFANSIAAFCRGERTHEFMYAYWPELDTTAHLAGPSSDEVAAHFATLEQALSPLLDIARQNDTLLLITADHGFIDSGPEERIDLESHPELQAMLTLPLCGEPRTAYAYVRAQCVNDFEQYIQSELADAIEVYRSQQLIDEHWFGLGDPHPELAARIGDYVLCMRERYTLRDRVIGEHDMQLHGVHGGLTRAEQIVPLIASTA